MTSKANNWNQSLRSEDRKEDKPPHSRVFVVCSKQITEDDLREPFEQFGEVEDLYIPRDRKTGEPRGVAYVKYAKTSSAAAAIEKLHMTIIKNQTKPIKVLVAVNKNENQNKSEDKYKRLFIKVYRDVTEAEIKEHFSQFGQVESVYLQRDKATNMCKGFAYVNFTNFLGAAKALEQCDKKYKPVFATPKDELKRSRNSFEGLNYLENSYYGSPGTSDSLMQIDQFSHNRDNIYNNDMISLIKSQPMSYDAVAVTCSPQVPQKHVEQLFNVVPGMVQCQYTLDTYNGFCKAIVTYESEKAAVFAVERLNNFEFPSGEIVSVKPHSNPLNKAANNLSNLVNNFKNSMESGNPDLLQLADAIAQASSLIKAATSTANRSEVKEVQESFCNIKLPPPKPFASHQSQVAERCFLVCKPHPPPMAVLRDVFSRFGDLIDVSLLPEKNFGFVKYASVKAAQDAIEILNEALVCGITLKVVQAEEKPCKEENMSLDEANDNLDWDKDAKRMKLHDI